MSTSHVQGRYTSKTEKAGGLGGVVCFTFNLGFPCGSAGEESACNAGDLESIPGWEDPLEDGKIGIRSVSQFLLCNNLLQNSVA